MVLEEGLTRDADYKTDYSWLTALSCTYSKALAAVGALMTTGDCDMAKHRLFGNLDLKGLSKEDTAPIPKFRRMHDGRVTD